MDILHSKQIKTPRINERSSAEELIAAYKQTQSEQYKKLIKAWLKMQGYDFDEPEVYHSSAMARALNAEQNQNR